MDSAPTIRIFFSSPGDVKLERETARRIVERLQAELGGRVRLEPYFWEHEVLSATRDYQENIPPMDGFGVFVCILWSRLGSPLDPRRHPRPDGGFFESGTEYEFYMARAAHRAQGAPEIFLFRNRTEPRRPSRPKEAREAVDREVDRLDEFIARNLREGEYYTSAVNSYKTLGEFEEKLTAALRGFLEPKVPHASGKSGRTRATGYSGRPYLGLAAFDYADARVFFGRTAQVGEIVVAFQTQELEARAAGEEGRRFVLVLGASGSGKSSLARAGVLPMLVQPGVIEGAVNWRRAIFRPGEAGGDPFLALAQALLAQEALPELASDGTDAAGLAGLLRRQSGGAGLLLRQALSQAGVQARHAEELRLREEVRRLESEHREEDVREAKERLARLAPPPVRLALLCDQLEELFTTDQPRELAVAFVECLAALARSGRCFVLATLRSDFYARCLEHPPLVELMKANGSHALAAPGPAELGQMIRQPAEVAGLVFEENTASGEMLDELLRDAALEDPTALPLLSYTLEQLYERRTSEGVLTLAAYRELGGLEGAIGKRAEAIFAALPGAAQAAFDGVWRQLVTLGEGGAPVRRHAALSALAASTGASELVEALVKARLLTADQATGGERSVSVAHEALLRHWPRVTAWVDANREFLRARSRLATRLAEWHERGKAEDYLIPGGTALGEAEGLLAAHANVLTTEEEEYIRRSTARVHAREQARLRRNRAITTGAVTLSVLAMVGGGFAWHERGVAEEQRTVARTNEQRAVAQEKLAIEQKEAAERNAREAHASQTRNAYLLGLEMLEAGKTRDGITSLAQTLVLDPQHTGARDRLYTHHLYGLPKAICLLSAEGPAGVRQRISGAGSGPEQRIAYLDERGAPIVYELGARTIVPGPWNAEPDLLAAVLERTGRHLLCVRKDSGFRVWSVTEGTASGVITTDSDWNQVELAEDGRWFAACWSDGSVRAWSLPEGRLVHEWVLDRPVEKIAFDSARGLLVCSADALVVLDLATGAEHARVLDPQWTFRKVVPAASGSIWAAWQTLRDAPVDAGIMERLVGFSSDTFHELPGSRSFDDQVFDCAVSEDGEEIAVASFSSQATAFLRSDADHPRNFTHSTYPTLVRFTPDARLVVTASSDGTVRIFDAETGMPAFEPIHGEGRLEDLEVSWDGRYLLTSTARRARVWDLAVGRALIQPLPQEGRPLDCVFAPQDRALWTATEGAGLQAWDSRSLEPLGAPLFQGTLVDCLFERSGAFAAVQVGADQLALVDLVRGESVGEPWSLSELCGGWAFGAGGARLAVACDDDVHFLATSDGKPAAEPWSVGALIVELACAPAGDSVAVLTSPSAVRCFDSGTRRESLLDSSGARVHNLHFSPDGRWLAGRAQGTSMSVEYPVLLWDLTAPEAPARRLEHGDYLRALAFSPDGRWLATGTRGQIAQVWDVERGEAACDPIFHDGNVVIDVLFSPDGDRLATYCGDDKVRIFDWREARVVSPAFEIRPPIEGFDPEPEDGLAGWAFSSDGKLIALSAPDLPDTKRGFTRLFELSPPRGLALDLVALTEAASALRVTADGARLAVDPYEGWRKLAQAEPARWFFQAPTRRSISPAFEATSLRWIHDENVKIDQTVSSLPAVGMVRAALSTWRQSALAASLERMATFAPGTPEHEAELANQTSLRREIAKLVEFTARGAGSDASICLWLGRQALSAGQAESARTWFERGLVSAPEDRELLMRAASVQSELQDHRASLVTLERLCALEPEDVDAHVSLGLLRWRLGDLDGARREFLSLLEHEEIEPLLRLRMLVCLGREEDALAMWSELGAADVDVSEDPDTFLLLLAAMFRVGLTDQAVESYAGLCEASAIFSDAQQLRDLGLFPDIAETLVQLMSETLARHPELAPQ